MECSICLKPKPKKTLACGHVFHKKCIEDWNVRQSNCPMCRYSFDYDGKRYVEWADYQTKNFDQIADNRVRVTTMIEIIDTSIKCSNKYELYASKKFYRDLISLTKEMQEDVNLGLCGWISSYIRGQNLVSYRWYENTLKSLKELEEKGEEKEVITI